MSIAATGPTPRPTTTVAASTNEHAAMRPVPRSGVQAGLLDPPSCSGPYHPRRLYELANLASTSLLGNFAGDVVLARRGRARAGYGAERRTAAGDGDRRAGSSRVGAESGRRTGSSEERAAGAPSDASGSSRDAAAASSTVFSRRARLSRVKATAAVAINPLRSTMIGKALLLGLTSVGVSALLTTRTWMRSFTGILAASCRAWSTSRKAFVAPNVSLVALRADVACRTDASSSASPALTVDGTAAAAIGRAPSFRSSSLSRPRRLSSPDDCVTGGESGVDIDQAREATRVGERRAAARRGRPEAPTAAPALPPASARASPGSTRSRASGRRAPTGRSERTTARPERSSDATPTNTTVAVAPKNIHVQGDVDLVLLLSRRSDYRTAGADTC